MVKSKDRYKRAYNTYYPPNEVINKINLCDCSVIGAINEGKLTQAGEENRGDLTKPFYLLFQFWIQITFR